ncbi:MAG: ABC transporter permease subunit, partial [Verrucomicrobia bacterium]|nr:ABC transporter permease subunit [Verrucomicrobiota bacterium]
AGPSTPQSEMGQWLFKALACMAFLYCAAAGGRVTADCLSEEKREGTLGLLFLTDLRGYDVVLGKLVATSVNSIYGLLAVLPVLALPLLLGGVDPRAVWQSAVALLDTLFLSLAAGMLVSAMCRNERKAMATTLLLLFILVAGLPIARTMLTEVFNHRPVVGPDPLLVFSPAYLFGQATVSLNTFGATRRQNFVVSAVAVQGLAWLFLAWASWLLPRSWQERPAGAIRLRWRQCWQLWTQGAEGFRQGARRHLLEANPFLWLAGRDRFKTDLVWAFLGLGGVVWFWGWATWGRDWLGLETGIATAVVLHGALKCWLASEASRRFVEDRRSGALELVLSTPMAVEEIVRGQMLALRRQFAGPMLVVLLADLLLMIAATRDSTVSTADRREELSLWLAAMFTLLTDAYTLSWVGMWQGLKARSVNRATVVTLGWVLALPWCLLGALATLATVFDLGPRFVVETQQVIFVVVTGFTLLNAGLWAWARHRVLADFRTAITLRFQSGGPPAGWWPWRRGASQLSRVLES